MLELLRSLLQANGRDASSFAVQTNLSSAGQNAGEWVHEARWWKEQGVTHLGLGGYTRDATPAQALQLALEKRRALAEEHG